MKSYSSPVNVKGTVHIKIWEVSPTGRHKLRKEFTLNNLITTAGKTLLAYRMIGISVPAIGWIGIGTSVVAPSVSDVLLTTEVFRDALTTSILSSPGVITFTYYLATGSANGNTLRELGLFNSATANAPTILSRVSVSPEIVKTISQAVTFTWTITFL